MTSTAQIYTDRITDEAGRRAALALLAATYEKEKGWIAEPHSQFPVAHLGRADISWYMVFMAGEPVGVLRTVYDPPLPQCAKYDLTILDARLDIQSVLERNRIAEVGRFAVLAAHRGNLLLAVALMRAAMGTSSTAATPTSSPTYSRTMPTVPWASTPGASASYR